MEQLMNEFAQKSKNRVSELVADKELKNIIIVEHTGSFCPEELIYAAGAKPYLMAKGGEPSAPEAVLEYLLRVMNPFVRTMAGSYMLGQDKLTELADLITFQETDCQIGRVSELMEYLKLPVFKIGVPSDWKKDLSAQYYYGALEKFKIKLEELTGKKIDESKLKEQIELQNKINDLFRQIDEFRKAENPFITGFDFIRLNHYSFFVEPKIAIEYLEKILIKLKENGKPAFEKKPVRILLAGHVVAVGDYIVPSLIEQDGGCIVCEMMDEGIRHFRHNTETEGDLVKNIGKRNYIDKLPPDIFQPAFKDRMEIMRTMIKDYNVDGVIWYQLVFDEIYDMESACVDKWLRKMHVPFLKLESSYEYSREAMGPLKTRIESFIKSINRKGE
ncbi:MAG: 2-hydroxyacyl-CoA dehydratase subunit D [Sedimentibacter sp.]